MPLELLKEAFNRPPSIANRQSGRPAVALALSFAAGIASSLILREYSFGGLVVADVLLICAGLLALLRDRLSLSLALGLAAIMLCGSLTALAHRDRYADSDLRSRLDRNSFPLNEPVCFEGCVVQQSESHGEESVATIKLRAFLQKNHWVVCKGKGILGIAESERGQSTEPDAGLMRGDRVRGWATWRIPRNYENPGSADRAGVLARRGIFIVGRVKSTRLLEIIPGDCSAPWTKMAIAVGDRVRTSLKHLTGKDRGQQAAILASLVIGDYSGLDNNTREVFQNSGTFHVLVVSGLHVAWIAGLLLQLFKLIRLPERIRYLLAAFVILAYACVVGFQASITRCLWVFILYLIGRMIFRKADSLNILFVSALVLLVMQPDWLFEPGFQLSFLSVMAIALTAVPAINAYLKPVWEPLQHTGNSSRLFLKPGFWHRCGRNLRTKCEIRIEAMTDTLPLAASRVLFMVCRGLAGAGLAMGSLIIVSLAVQIWISPLLAHYFNRLSWISPLANLVVVPLSSIVLAAGIIGSLATGLPFCGPALIQLAGWLSSLLLSTAGFITRTTGAWQRCPTPSEAWVLAGMLLLFAWGFFEWHRFWIPCSFVVILLACLSRGWAPVPNIGFRGQKEKIWQRDASLLRFTFLDVGEGDAAVICFPDKQLWVLDAGGLRLPPSQEDSSHAFDIGEAVVSRYLWHGWITRLDRLVMSHTDLDHAGGIPAVMNNFQVARFNYSPASADDAIFRSISSIARRKQIDSSSLFAGMEEKVGPVAVRTLNPPANSRLMSTNENSLVLQFSFKRFSALLTGDLEKSGETEVLSQQVNLGCQLLKVAHHGSRSGTSNALLDRTKPRWAVVSVGSHNSFGHPSPEVLARLLRHGARPMLTIDEGAITFETNGDQYVIHSYVSGILEQGNLKE